jgi:N(2)-fixation sustaining protein CowN
MSALSDRYVSFTDIDFAGNMAGVLGHLRRYIDDPAKTNLLWERFKLRLAKAEADALPINDRLLLLHSHVYYMVELFEEADDAEAMMALEKLERECF